MGIRKGWALCGAREERCFISHAVSSHPLLELQTLGLSTLSSPHYQDLPLDSIQKNSLWLSSLIPTAPTSLLFSFEFFFCLSHYFTCHLPPPPSLLSEDGNSLVTNLIYHFFYFCWRWRQEKRESILETFVVKEHTSFPAYSFLFSFSFFVLSSSPSWLSLWGYHSWFCTCKWYVKGGYCVWIPCPLLLLLLVFFFFSLGGAGVGWRTEARWEITGMGSH